MMWTWLLSDHIFATTRKFNSLQHPFPNETNATEHRGDQAHLTEHARRSPTKTKTSHHLRLAFSLPLPARWHITQAVLPERRGFPVFKNKSNRCAPDVPLRRRTSTSSFRGAEGPRQCGGDAPPPPAPAATHATILPDRSPPALVLVPPRPLRAEVVVVRVAVVPTAPTQEVKSTLFSPSHDRNPDRCFRGFQPLKSP